MSLKVRWLSLCCLLALVLVPGEAASQGSGVVHGRVEDAVLGPLGGALVKVEGTSLEAWTDSTGRYRLSGVPAGSQSLAMSFVAAVEKMQVEVAAGASVEANFKIQLRFTEVVTVVQPLLEGQARALAQQQAATGIANFVAADQISSFPDPNVAEAAQRIPGVTLQREDGEGARLVIRGLDPKLNSVSLNGERVPSTEQTDRTVSLIQVPTEILQSIEVYKAITPDQDGDAIGGTVNLVTKQAPEKPRLDLSYEGGYNRLVETAGNKKGSLTLGRRFADGRWGAVVSGSAQDENRGEDLIAWVYDTVPATPTLSEVTLNHERTTYQRYSANAALDWLSPAGHTAFLRGTYARQDQNKVRLRARLRSVSAGPSGRGDFRTDMRDRHKVREIVGVSAGSKLQLGERALLDFQAAVSKSHSEDKDTLNTRFRQRNATFRVTSGEDYLLQIEGALDPSKATFVDVLSEPENTRDRDITAQANLTIPFGSTGTSGFFKFGAKYRDKNKDNHETETAFGGSGVPPLSGFSQQNADDAFFGGRFVIPPFPSVGDNASMIERYRLVGVLDHAADSTIYVAGEQVAAGYAMAEVRPAAKVTIVAGARYERTANDYQGSLVTFNEAGAFVSSTPTSSKNNYGSLLPMAHLRIALSASDTLRAAVTRALARPDYFALVPYVNIDNITNKISRGNPDLQETNCWNADLLAEHYFKSVGIASVGVFYKSLSDYVYPFTFTSSVNNELFTITEPRNGPSATVYGFEAALQNRLSFLPKPLDGIGIYANYTYSHSEADYTGRAKGPLTGQAKHTANLALSYEKGGFSGRVALNMVGRYVSGIGDRPETDFWRDRHVQIDANAQQRLFSKVTLFVTALNLNDSRDRGYLSTLARPEHDEILSWWGTFGIRVHF